MSYCFQSQSNNPENISCETLPKTFQSSLRSEQVISLAELIVEGRNSFPMDLATSDQQRLLVEVRRRRKARLMRHIADLIAQDIRKG